jgi:hypothetical protein
MAFLVATRWSAATAHGIAVIAYVRPSRSWTNLAVGVAIPMKRGSTSHGNFSNKGIRRFSQFGLMPDLRKVILVTIVSTVLTLGAAFGVGIALGLYWLHPASQQPMVFPPGTVITVPSSANR